MIYRIGNIALTVAIGLFAVTPLLSQTPTQKPAFEVVSVKPSPPGSRTRDNTRGNRFAISGAPLRLLLRYAYPQFLNSQIVNVPAWVDSDLFDVEGKSDSVGNISQAQMQLLVQSLLENRFQLLAHVEMRESPIYELRVGKNEPKIKPSENQTVAAPQPGPFKPDAPPPGILAVSRSLSGTIKMVGVAIQLSDFVSSLARQVSRPVIDKTNLTGLFDVRFEFVPEGVSSAPAVPGATAPLGASDPSGPFLLEAVERELGLKLEAAKEPVEVLVIDSVQRPTEN